ncbi:MAG: RIP metalloprotease RseP [Candidatus Omnitrophica bacterium]|nr:RIP metalloprotease RseP [Candidatus Omnitrophota bacterium]
MLTFISATIVLSILILVHEFGHFIVAKKSGVKVERFSIGFGKEIIGWTRGETRYSVSLLPLGGYVKMAGENQSEVSNKPDEFFCQPIKKRFWILSAGAIFNYLLGFLLFFFIFMLGNPQLTAQIGEIKEGFPAEKILQKGDYIISINNKAVSHWEEMAKIISQSKEPLNLIIKRGSENLSATISPREDNGRRVLGILPSGETIKVRYNPFAAFYLAGKRTLRLTALTYAGLWKMITRQISWKSLTGPVGVIYITGKVAKMGILPLLQFMAVLTINLGLFNLLPLPMLDGGHLLFLGLEKLRKKPISEKAQEIAQNIGVLFLIILFIAVLWGDFSKISLWKALP